MNNFIVPQARLLRGETPSPAPTPGRDSNHGPLPGERALFACSMGQSLMNASCSPGDITPGLYYDAIVMGKRECGLAVWLEDDPLPAFLRELQ